MENVLAESLADTQGDHLTQTPKGRVPRLAGQKPSPPHPPGSSRLHEAARAGLCLTGKRGEPRSRPGHDWLHLHGPRTNSQAPDLQPQAFCASWDRDRLGAKKAKAKQSPHRDTGTLPRELWPCLSLLSPVTTPARTLSPLSGKCLRCGVSRPGWNLSLSGTVTVHPSCPGIGIPQGSLSL